MTVTGVITEFNPLHNGHAYFLQKARELTHADYIVAIMSGDYVQRGEPALMDKHVRTLSALKSGADLVIELPTALACASAEYFARGAVGLLNQLSIVDYLVFGSEAGSLDVLKEEEPDMPNDILGCEYLKALTYFNSAIVPLTIARIGTGYHDSQTIAPTDFGFICSASFLREHCGKTPGLCSASLIPEAIYPDYCSYRNSHNLLSFSSLSDLLFYKLNALQFTGYDRYFDVYGDLSCKIRQMLESYVSADDFRQKLKSKDISFRHISRSLLHILLDITKEEILSIQDAGYTPYCRILGFRRDASGLLHMLKETSRLPLITKLADAGNINGPSAMEILSKDIMRSHLYQHLAMKNAACIPNEYRRPFLVLP